MRTILLFLLSLLCLSVQAHPLNPSLIFIDFYPAGKVSIEIRTNLEARMAGVGPQHSDTDDAPEAAIYNELRKLSPNELKQRFTQFDEQFRSGVSLNINGQKTKLLLENVTIPETGDVRRSRLSKLVYSANIPVNASEATWQYNRLFGHNVVYFFQAGSENRVSNWLMDGATSPVYSLTEQTKVKSRIDVAVEYLVLGFEHILPKGLDHILFVLGLFLLSIHWRPLFWQVTSFTIAHSITLALSIYGYISLPSEIVEPLIALSIAYVGIENLLTKELHLWRSIVVFLFGLLHGMGFASVLTDLGLPRSEFVTALITFNIGVELGQISVIIIAFLLVYPVLKLKRESYRTLIVIPGSLAIAAMGIYWTWERLT